MSQLSKQTPTTFLLTVTLDEADLLELQIQRHGVGLLDAWLKDRRQLQDDGDIQTVREGRADLATKARIRTRLGL